MVFDADSEAATIIERAASLLEANGRASDAAELMTVLRAPVRHKPILFVAGEAKRGKSCLVNTLMGQQNLSPVGVEPTTSAPITFFRSAEPQAMVFRFGEEKPELVDVARAQALATVQGNPNNHENVRAVSIGADIPALEGFDLVDTPGAGGLDSGHGVLTLQSLRDADALLFVLEAGAPIRAPELQFLREASARVDTVLLALTKTDIHRGWRTILSDNLAVLQEQAPRFARCPVLPVSSFLAMRALEYPEDADELRHESGLSDLDAALAHYVVDRAADLKQANLLRAVVGYLGALARTVQQRIAATQAGSTGREALEAEQGRLRDLHQDRAEWPHTLDTEMRKLTLERQEMVSVRSVEIRRRYEERLKQIAKKEHESLPGELMAELTALGEAVNEMSSVRLVELAESLLSTIDNYASLQRAIDAISDHSLHETLQMHQLGDYSMKATDKISLFSTFGTGRTLGSVVSGSGLGLTATAFVAPPVALAIGFAIGGLFAFQAFRTRTRQAFASEFESWMRDQIAHAQLAINNSFSRNSIDLQDQLKASIRELLTEREREINEALAAAKADVAAESGRQDQARQALRQTYQTCSSLRKEAAKVLARMMAEPGSATSPEGAGLPGT